MVPKIKIITINGNLIKNRDFGQELGKIQKSKSQFTTPKR